MHRFRPYSAEQIEPAYALRYAWFTWLSDGHDVTWPNGLSARIAPLWEVDGIRLLNAHRNQELVVVNFSAKPSVCPILLAQRAKGRLTYQLRCEGVRHEFSRKFAVRSIGENTNRDVEIYIARQVERERFMDAALRGARFQDPEQQAGTSDLRTHTREHAFSGRSVVHPTSDQAHPAEFVERRRDRR